MTFNTSYFTLKAKKEKPFTGQEYREIAKRLGGKAPPCMACTDEQIEKCAEGRTDACSIFNLYTNAGGRY